MSVTGAITLTVTHQNDTLEMNDNTICTLDDISTIAASLHTSGFTARVVALHASGVAIICSGTDEFFDGTTVKTLAQYEWITVQMDSTGNIWNIVSSSNALKLGGVPAANYLRSDIADTANSVIDFINKIKFAGVLITKTAAQINDLATLTGTETLTNKTLTSATVSGNFTGDLTGNADSADYATNAGAAGTAVLATTVTINAPMNGDVETISNITTINPNVIEEEMFQDIEAASTVTYARSRPGGQSQGFTSGTHALAVIPGMEIYQVIRTGTYRVTWKATTNKSMHSQLYINGVANGSPSFTANSTTTQTVDITLTALAYLQIYGDNNNDPGTSTVSDFKISGSVPLFG